jgi:hypothetical protein
MKARFTSEQIIAMIKEQGLSVKQMISEQAGSEKWLVNVVSQG